MGAEDDTELIVAKAIRDGAIEAELDHENGWMTSKTVVDIYSSNEPQSAFHARIAFCLDLHNESVRAMRYDSAKIAVDGNKDRVLGEEDIEKAIEALEEDDF